MVDDECRLHIGTYFLLGFWNSRVVDFVFRRMVCATVTWLRFRSIVQLPIPQVSDPVHCLPHRSAVTAQLMKWGTMKMDVLPSSFRGMCAEVLVCFIALAAQQAEEVRRRLATMIEQHVCLGSVHSPARTRWMCWFLLSGSMRRPMPQRVAKKNHTRRQPVSRSTNANRCVATIPTRWVHMNQCDLAFSTYCASLRCEFEWVSRALDAAVATLYGYSDDEYQRM